MTAGKTSPFIEIQQAAPDPILDIKKVFTADERPKKVDLSIGVYQNDEGLTPTLEVVEEAITRIPLKWLSGGYLPIEGLAEYTRGVQQLLFGPDAPVVREGRVVTVQSVGGTSALRYGADFLKRYFPGSTVYLSDPTWENHRAIFERAGFQLGTYPYFEPKSGGLAFDAMREALSRLAPRSVVLLHLNCHNPTGVDLSGDQWESVIEILQQRELVPFIDFAYQGFGDGIDEDALPLRRCVEAGLPLLVANSFSKNFSLYRRRVGALSIVTGSKEEAARVFSQLRTDIRTNNSNPPVDGAAMVATVLGDQHLHAKWEHEVAVMRNRICRMRERFVEVLTSRGMGERFQRVLTQRGMFSYSGLTKDEVQKLKSDFAIYTVGSGRICVAALTERNVEYVAEAVATVCR